MIREKEAKLDNVIETAMASLNNLVDVNTVVGKPITTLDGSTIIPVSKVTMGFITGGGEYGEVKVLKKSKDYPFGGGSGAVMSMKPYGFLIDNGSGFKMVSAANEPLDKIIDSAQDIINKISGKDNEKTDN